MMDVTTLQIAKLLESITLRVDGEGTDLIECFPDDEWRSTIDDGSLTQLAKAARSRLNQPVIARHDARARNALLEIAERLDIVAGSRHSTVHQNRAWPSGQISFDEFLIQWPCEIELPVDLDDRIFIVEAC